ncbi:ferredoxin--NADP reductase [Psychromonas ossibalaenae]|uniref:ferredoxin--NADP reductase n=1 Tax=Psychromonas ossibalaenae TaxID=444922 RepID=UPI000365B0E9|nr:ferredoxin--NADP reductase [Psychromonas ossibalaenae]
MKEIPHGLIKGRVIGRTDWTDNEFSLKVNAPVEPYLAGQFTKLALLNEAGEWVRRAYSLVNSPNHKSGHQEMEFLLISVSDGELSSQLQNLQVDDTVYVGKQAAGFMTLAEIPEHITDLWLLSTGTAVGPFLSILDEHETRARFKKIVLVHAVRTKAELVYQSKIEQTAALYKDKFVYMPVVSREQCDGALQGRIPQLLQSGLLAETAQVRLTAENSFFYLCGNPDMVKETSEQLVQLGYKKHLRRKPGNFSSENYW